VDPSGHDYKLPSGNRIKELANNKNYIGLLPYLLKKSIVNQYSGYDKLLNPEQGENLSGLKKIFLVGNNDFKAVAALQAISLRNDGCSYIINGCQGGSATIASKSTAGLTIKYLNSKGKMSLVDVFKDSQGNTINAELILLAGIINVNGNPKWEKVDSINSFLQANSLHIYGYGRAEPGMQKLLVRNSNKKYVGEIHVNQPAGRGNIFPRHFQYYLQNSNKTDPGKHYYE
jgi:hypothetical protein